MSKNRTERLQLRLSPEEKEAIRQKAAQVHMSSADYLVALSENKMIIDPKQLAKLLIEFRRVGININQIAAVANSQKFVSKELLLKVTEDQKKLTDIMIKILNEVYDAEKHDIRTLENKFDKLTKAVEGLMKNGNGQGSQKHD